MLDHLTVDTLVRRVDKLERELAHLKRDLLWVVQPSRLTAQVRPSLFGIIAAGDITPEMIDGSQDDLFRPLEDL